jgi:deoxyribonuclease-4
MIRFGPAGIPLSCKGRTVRDGVLYVRALELDAMEVQFVRGIRMTEEDAEKIREAAEACDVELHVKAPYYLNLAGDEKNVEMSFQKMIATGRLAHIMGAETVVFHPGFYGDLSKEDTMERIVSNLRQVRNTFIREGWKPRLGIEVMGKRNVFGSLDEVVQVCKRVKGVIPVVDFAHLHARGNGILQEPEDFQLVFDRLEELNLDHYLVHFTGIHYDNGNARYRLPIKKADLKFEPLCEVLLAKNYHCTILSTSPIMEHDGMYMNIVFDRVKERRDQRITREIREGKEAEEKAKQQAIEKEQREKDKAVRDKEEKERKEKEAIAKAKKDAEDKARRIKEDAEARRTAAEKHHAKSGVMQTDDSGRRQVSWGDYKLYKKGNRFQFMKAKKDEYSLVFKVPEGKVVEPNHQGVPMLRDPPQFRKPTVTQTDATGRRQVQVDEYKLYQKEGRFYFMKEKKTDFSLVFKVADDKEVAFNQNGIPLLRNKKA